ncbi:cytochrome P450 9e2-like [Diabrotica virgifera virgifera]|uniref:Cytochrome P450 9e2-like n=1 Tax=Diabrotica virgifera virgifera TaxID=50390 RepID=A0A6P7GF43_DIAVI|nr:cytochrome P450 9e2-like [Diabrotica virgifera virgifera]XP_050497946.1 cytochrome P450 9e2-like [Diabrotica virgifera virgifera]XP_050497947.1 cytochrome P450 9e2-like [Diabrotica virgifera virgifera]
MLIPVLLIICISLLYYYVTWLQNYWTRRKVPQGDTVWLFGDLFWFILRRESTAAWVKRVYDIFPNTRYSGSYQFTTPTLIIKDVDLIKKIAIKDFDTFPDHRTYVPETSDPLWAKNLFAVKVPKWRQMRPVLSPAFTSSKMKLMFNLMIDCVDHFVGHFKNGNNEVVEVECTDVFSRFATDVIGSCAFGFEVNSVKEANNEFYQKGLELTDFTNFWKNFALFGYMIIPGLYKLLNLKIVSDEESKYYHSIIEKTIKLRKEKGIIRHDMIHLLMEARDEANKLQTNGDHNDWNISDEDIIAQAIVFYFAGFDTITLLLTYLFYELALNPDIQNKLRNEVEQTLKECDGKVTYEALFKMKYMDMAVSETLRKYPINVIVDRVCTKPYIIEPTAAHESPISLEVGTVVWIPIYPIHHDPKYYPEPEKFDPERFNEDNKSTIVPGSYIPFGIGPRNCIGSRFALMETKILCFYILHHFEIVPTKKTMIPVSLSPKTFNMKPDKSIWLGLKRRNESQ